MRRRTRAWRPRAGWHPLCGQRYALWAALAGENPGT